MNTTVQKFNVASLVINMLCGSPSLKISQRWFRDTLHLRCTPLSRSEIPGHTKKECKFKSDPCSDKAAITRFCRSSYRISMILRHYRALTIRWRLRVIVQIGECMNIGFRRSSIYFFGPTIYIVAVFDDIF